MPETPTNPFNITKAADLSNHEINTYFVDISEGGYAQMANPSSVMPMLIRGGKGSGKTHVMRYYSYPLQKIRAGRDFVPSIKREGYLGVYLRCGGLNASRFAGKGQPPDVWRSVFAYYMELWLGQLVLETAADFAGCAHVSAECERLTIESCLKLFDEPVVAPASTLRHLAEGLRSAQQRLDIEVNNVPMTRSLNIRVAASPGSLVFGIPRLLTQMVDAFAGLLVVYLLDEYENLYDEQQRYFNTLVREREAPCTFKIGGRIYGFKTYKTYSADEEIKEGSEYEVLPLDYSLRQSKDYANFARLLCARRLVDSGHAPAGSKAEALVSILADAFEVPITTKLLESETAFVKGKYNGRERPYLTRLREKLSLGAETEMAPGITSERDVEQVIRLLAKPGYPLIEKTNTFRLYQLWRTSCDLIETARSISEQSETVLTDGRAEDYESVLQHYKLDMLAQLLRDCGQKQRYVGLETFIEMSEGLPRNLLIILKLVFKWAVFNGERPFRPGGISTASQQAGVKQAAEWFFNDARMPGDDGQAIRDSISRLARLFREIRFSDKPSECSLCAFSADLPVCSDEARRIISLAENWSLLVNITGGQRDRNSLRVDEKFQLNGMLAPHWDLPISRRGVLALNRKEVNAIFDAADAKDFEDIVSERVGRMTAPAFGRKGKGSAYTSQQSELPLT